MSFDRSQARCSFCGRHTSEVRRMIAGPGAAYICEDCLQLCMEILQDPMPFSPKALELASRPPVVFAAPPTTHATTGRATKSTRSSQNNYSGVRAETAGNDAYTPSTTVLPNSF